MTFDGNGFWNAEIVCIYSLKQINLIATWNKYLLFQIDFV